MTKTPDPRPGSERPGARPRIARPVAWALGGLTLLGLPGLPSGQPTVRLPDTSAERTVSREQITLEMVRIEGQLQTWVMRRVCLDGQVYWFGFNETAPTAMAPSFKDGKPEQCPIRPR
jgi:hypothetical protein